jgi:hypothetical protein
VQRSVKSQLPALLDVPGFGQQMMAGFSTSTQLEFHLKVCQNMAFCSCGIVCMLLSTHVECRNFPYTCRMIGHVCTGRARPSRLCIYGKAMFLYLHICRMVQCACSHSDPPDPMIVLSISICRITATAKD